MLFWPVLIIGIAVLALLLAQPASDVVIIDEHVDMRAVYLAVLAAGLVIAGTGRLLLRGGHKTLAHTAAWLGTIAGLATAYGFRDQAAVIIQDLRTEMSEKFAPSVASGAAVLSRDWDGHYLAEAEVNGVEMTLMIDTGASMVLIPFEQAAALGINLDTLEFSMPVTTANGSTTVAPIQLSSIRVQHIAVFDIHGAVAQPGRLKTGLLGMSFLEHLAETSFRGDHLILRQTLPSPDTSPTRAPANN
jgi:aspartyl protease family protein